MSWFSSCLTVNVDMIGSSILLLVIMRIFNFLDPLKILNANENPSFRDLIDNENNLFKHENMWDIMLQNTL